MCKLVHPVDESFLVIPIDALILLLVCWLFVVALSGTSTLAVRPTQPVRALCQARRRPVTTEAQFRRQSIPRDVVVYKVAMAQVSLPLLGFPPVGIIPPMPQTHLHPNTAAIRRTSGRNVGTVQKAVHKKVLSLGAEGKVTWP